VTPPQHLETADDFVDQYTYIRSEIRQWARTAEITQPNLRLSLISIAEGVGLWSTGIILGTALGGWTGRLVGWPVIMAALIRLQYLFHESAHRSVFHRRWLNDLLGALLGSLAFVPHAAYRAQHLEHHRLTRVDRDGMQDPEGFYDEVATRLGYVATVLFGGSYLSLWYTWQIVKCVGRQPVSWLPSARRTAEMGHHFTDRFDRARIHTYKARTRSRDDDLVADSHIVVPVNAVHHARLLRTLRRSPKHSDSVRVSVASL
jgi:hypothetical protein